MSEHEIDWTVIGEQLRAPFDPNDVDFRVQGRVNEQTGKGQVVAYIDARGVQDRLDEVVGPGNWAFEWEPIVVDKGDVQIAKGTLTIHGVSKSDAGTASNFEATLGAVSHCFKRAAVHWGIGRYLYGVSSAWVQIEKGGRISNEVLRELRAKLPRPAGVQSQPVQTAQRSFTANPPVIRPAVDERQQKLQRQNDADLADQPWPFLQDVELRNALNKRNIRDVAAVAAFVASATHKLHEPVTYADRDLCLAAATSLEGLAGKR